MPLSEEQVLDLSIRYGSKSNVYRAAVKSGLSVYQVAKAFGVSKGNVYSKCYHDDARRKTKNTLLMKAVSPLTEEDRKIVEKASGVNPRRAKKRKTEVPGLQDRIEELFPEE